MCLCVSQGGRWCGVVCVCESVHACESVYVIACLWACL